MYTGTIQSQVKMQMLDLKWQKKKDDINQKHNNEELTDEEVLMQSIEEQAENVRKSRDTEQIYTKLKTGQTLSEEEIAYLKEHDPESLSEYEKAQSEKKAYEQQLKNCKTKEDVQRLTLNRMGNFAAKAKSIASNPYIPKIKKMILMNRLNNEVCLIRDAHLKFTESVEYRNMPEEAELAEEKKSDNEGISDGIDKTDIIADNDDTSTTDNNDIPISDIGDTSIPDKEDTPNYDTTDGKKSVSESVGENENLSFDKISRDIERYIHKNSEKKARFTASV